MAPYEQNGFLGDDIKAWMQDNRRQYDDLFALAEKLNADCYTMLGKARPHNKDKRELLVSCLFPRVMELFQGTYLLVTHGMIPASNIMLRALIETMFVLVAIVKDDDALDAYILNDEKERLITANKILNDTSSTFSEIPIEEVIRIKAEIEKKHEGKKLPKLTTEYFSKKAGLHDWYMTVYAVTSKSVHAAVKDMEQYLAIGSDLQVKSIKFVPTDAGTIGILATACNALGMGLEAFLAVLNLETDICTEYAEKLRPFLELALTEKD
jgi:hypothetical protein